MSTPVETAEKWYRFIAERDMESLRALCDPDIEFIIADGFPAGGRWVGRDTVFDEFFPESFRAWKWLVPEVDEIFASEGDAVTVRGRYVGVTRETGTDFNVPYAHLWRVKGDRLCWLQQYVDTALLNQGIAGETAQARA